MVRVVGLRRGGRPRIIGTLRERAVQMARLRRALAWKTIMMLRPAVVPAVVPAARRRGLVRGLAAMAAQPWLLEPVLAQSEPPRDTPMPAIGSRLAVPAVTRLDSVRFEPAPGRSLVLYWWASWCPFCALQSPEMELLWRTQSAKGLQFLGLSIDRRAEDAQAYLTRRGYTFPSAWVDPVLASALPKPKGLPVTVVLGRSGTVVLAEAGQLFPEDVAAIARHV